MSGSWLGMPDQRRHCLLAQLELVRTWSWSQCQGSGSETRWGVLCSRNLGLTWDILAKIFQRCAFRKGHQDRRWEVSLSWAAGNALVRASTVRWLAPSCSMAC